MAVTLQSLQPHLFGPSEMSSSSFPSSFSMPSQSGESQMPPIKSKSKTGTSVASTAAQSTASAAAGVVKPKQSKSRNGCVTCKAKRLKCDETKPTCLQCEKRGVPCGGYKKDFKWRAFEESDLSGKGSKSRPKRMLSSRAFFTSYIARKAKANRIVGDFKSSHVGSFLRIDAFAPTLTPSTDSPYHPIRCSTNSSPPPPLRSKYLPNGTARRPVYSNSTIHWR
ncbi:hypothetical protein ABW19_dt0206896 [Dactylella cylindrospora]|nr:hypothetical protein ABW19_dt0206896 [Dactylella cylindrospora]